MIEFRPMTEDDVDLVAEWLDRPHVREWWGEPMDRESVAAKYGPRIRGEFPTEMFVVRRDGADIGLIQRYRASDHADFVASVAPAGIDASDAAGIDYLIGELGRIGDGSGTAMIAAFTEKLFAELDVSSIVVTPQAANIASCRVLEKAGYERYWVGMLDSDDPSDSGEAAVYVRHRRSLPNEPAASKPPS